MLIKQDDNVRNLCLQSASYNVLFQVSVRILTFCLNMLIFHSADNEVLGIINDSLPLLSTSILFLSREAFRKSCQHIIEKKNWPLVINLIWLTVPFTIINSALFCYIWLYRAQQPSEQHQQDYGHAVKLFALGCIIESFAEPMYILSQALFYVRWKVFMESLMTYLSIFLKAILVVFYPQAIICGTAYGQVVISSLVLILYLIFFHHEFKKKQNVMKLNEELRKEVPLNEVPFSSLLDILPHWPADQQWFDRDVAKHTEAFFKQGIFKLFLTEGERYVVTAFPIISYAERGIYSSISNLCSLPTRLIFHPVGENSYTYFAKKLSLKKPLREFSRRDVKQISQDLFKLFQTNALIGYGIVAFGISFSHLLLRLYGGSKLVDEPGPSLMGASCIAVCLMAVNGISEAYFFAAIDSDSLDRHNWRMAYFSCTFVFFSWLFGRIFGSVGLVIANICNMGLRISQSLRFIHNHFQGTPGNPLLGLLPNRAVLLALISTLMLTSWSQRYFYPQSIMLHLAIGASCAALVSGTVLYTVPVFQELYHALRASCLRKMRSCYYIQIKSK